MTSQEEILFRRLSEKIARLEKRMGIVDTLEMSSGGGSYTDEEAQDAVGTILTDSATVDFTYTDATPAITASVKTDAVDNTFLANMAQNTIKGRVTASTGDPEDLTATNVRTIINVASGADVTGTAITALTTKTTPVDADAVVITDSAASNAPKRTLWSNVKATLKTYFDTLYEAVGAIATHAALTATHGATGAVVGTTNTQNLTNKNVLSLTATISDDSFTAYTPSSGNSGVWIVTCNNDSTVGAIVAVRAAATVYCVSLSSLSNVNVTTGALTGTTGTDTKVTISADSAGVLYIENRRGTALIFKTLFVG